VVFGGLVSLAMLVGCAERTVFITSEPAGALVWVNDKELGRTPLSSEFTYYGTYDVRLRLEGYEPLRTSAEADTPIYEFPPLDLASEAVPGGVETKVRWHFVMEPSLESTMQGEALSTEVIRRAQEMAGRTNNESTGTSGTAAETPAPPPAAAPEPTAAVEVVPAPVAEPAPAAEPAPSGE
jgi:hypothetical protein